MDIYVMPLGRMMGIAVSLSKLDKSGLVMRRCRELGMRFSV
jgi:hypothetical protein